MFSPGKESDAQGALDIMMEGEEKVGVPGSLRRSKTWTGMTMFGVAWSGRRRKLCAQLQQHGRRDYHLEEERYQMTAQCSDFLSRTFLFALIRI